LRTLWTLAKLAVVGIIALLLLLWLDHTRETTLPAPTGAFAVGRTMDAWSDAAQQDALAPEPGAPRQLLAWIWYPAAPGQNPQPVEYLPAPWRTAFERHASVVIIKLVKRDLSRVRASSLRDAEVSPEQRSYPVIIMRAGLAALTTGYTTLAEDLASHGYVVVGFDAPYRTSVVVLPDGKVIQRTAANNADLVGGATRKQLANKLLQAWTADVGFALDRLERLNASDPSGCFTGRLDLQRVGVFGHSLGGATALQFCHNDSRCKAGIEVDGMPLGDVLDSAPTHPFMFLLSDHSRDPPGQAREVQANILSIYNRMPVDGRSLITIRGANHFMFSDDSALLGVSLITPVLRAFGALRSDGRRQLALAAHYISAFFDVHLKGEPASTLEKRPADSEIEFAE